MQTPEVRYPDMLRTRVPRELIDAVDLAARAKFQTSSEYVRQALVRSLQADAVIPKPAPVAA